jgi:hypothetical protein
MKLYPGMLIRTNYSWPYRIEQIDRDCTCPSYQDSISMKNPPNRRPHIHLTCTKPDGTDKYWLNGWCEDTLLSLDMSYCGGKTELDYDHIVILDQDEPVQTTLL